MNQVNQNTLFDTDLDEVVSCQLMLKRLRELLNAWLDDYLNHS
jgi:hypothetical protein